MRKRLISVCIAATLILSICGCTQTAEDTLVEEMGIVETENIETESEEEVDADDTFLQEQESDPLLLLKDGNIQQITGFEFGDKFDYNIFYVAGYDGNDCMYRLRDAKDGNLLFHFNEVGNRFSEISAYDGDFCGIVLDENTMDKVVPVLGEPDEYEKDRNGEGQTAIYYLEKAVFKLHINQYKAINYVNYIAAEGIADGDATADEPTEYDTALQDDFDYAETIYCWGNEQDRAFAHPYEDDYDESRIPQFIKEYLTERGTYKAEPDGIAYIQDGDRCVEYYKVGNQYSFIFHDWADYWIDYKAGTSAYRDAVYCTTVTLDDESKAGNLIYAYDTEHDIAREELYDAWGMRMCGISYEYLPELPFPFITESWNLDTGYDLTRAALCREHKTWFYKELAEYDEDGRFIGYSEYKEDGSRSDSRLYLPNACICIYDEEGRLNAIQEELQEYDIEREWGWWDKDIDYSGQMKFTYQKNGMISEVEYIRSSYTHGTYDSDGTIFYDEKGRMIYNEHYVTHGTDAHIYLYEGDSDKPWACLDWCSFVPGFESIYIYERE